MKDLPPSSETSYNAGSPIRIGRHAYHHYAIISDRVADGKPMLISLSYRTGTVAEERWDNVVRGRSVRPSRLISDISPAQVVERARAQIGRRRYNLLTSNCEHFVRDMLGLPARSRQLSAAAGVGITALLLALRMARGHPAIAIASTVAGLMIGSRFSAK